MKLRSVIVMCALTVGAGCYKYAPSTLESVEPNNKVRLLLSTEGELALEEKTGLRVRELTGQIVEMDDRRLLVEVPMAEVDPDFGGGKLNQRVEVPREHVLRIDAREPDPARTGLLVAVSAGGVAALVTFGVSSGSSGGDNGGTPPGPPERRAFWIYLLPSIRY